MTERVAIVGAGPGGLVVARWLVAYGFEVTLYEAGRSVGGQWTGDAGRSGVWPGLHTNTSRILTAFSDLPLDGTAVFPSNQEIAAYLERYAAMFDLVRRVRFQTRVDEILRHPRSGWMLRHAEGRDHVDRLVIASGRFRSPAIPSVRGLETFTGRAGAMSTFHFRGAERYRGQRVLVAGCAVSALEIASELAHAGAEVIVCQRRQRYVLPKFVAGVPSDHRIFTRFGALAAEALPSAEIERQLKELVVESGGNPEQYGAPAPVPSLFAAGLTLGQDYLPLVAEGRITVRPWMSAVDGQTVTFADDTTATVDGILFGTGFRLDLPFLDADMRATVDLDQVHLDADRYTFHPDLPNLAFAGLWDQSGGYFVPLELQARWIAGCWAGVVPTPDPALQRRAIDDYRSRRGLSQKTRMNLAALTFARAAGVEPKLEHWPQLRRALLFGPLAPSCFRLDGPDALPGSDDRFATEAAAFGAVTDGAFTERERRYLDMIG